MGKNRVNINDKNKIKNSNIAGGDINVDAEEKNPISNKIIIPIIVAIVAGVIVGIILFALKMN